MQHQRIARTGTAQLHLQPADRMPVLLAHQLPRHQQIEDVGEDRLDPRRGEILVDAEQRVGEIDDVAVPRRRGEPDPPGRGGMLMGAEILPLTIEIGFDRIQQHLRSRRPHPRAALVHDEFLFGQTRPDLVVRHDEIPIPIGVAQHPVAVQRIGLVAAVVHRHVRADDFAAAMHVVQQLPLEFGGGRDLVGKDDEPVPREVHVRIDDVELASQFREHPVGADQRIGQRAVHVPFAFRRHDRYVRHRVGVQRVRFEGLHLGVDPSDQIVGGVGQPASRMELVPDGAAGAHRQHLEALVFHRVLVLQRMEITPIRVELARHADHGLAEIAHVPHHDREIVIAPNTAGQALDLQMGERVQRGLVRGADVRTVEEQGRAGHPLVHEVVDLAAELVEQDGRIPFPLADIGVIEAMTPHLLLATPAIARHQEEDIQEKPVDAVRAEAVDDIVEVIDEVGPVVAVQAQRIVEVRLLPRGLSADRVALGVWGKPLGMVERAVPVPSHARVDGDADAALVACVYLLGQEALIRQVRMHELGMTLRGIEQVAVMVAGETGYRVYVRALQTLREFRGVEIIGDVLNVGTGMKIKIDLAIGETSCGGHH